MNTTLKELNEKMGQLNADARKIVDACDAEAAENTGAAGSGKGKLSQEDSTKVDSLYDEWDKLDAQVKVIKKQESRQAKLDEHAEYMSQSAGRKTRPEVLDVDDGGEAAPISVKIRGETVSFAPDSQEGVRAGGKYRDAFSQYLVTGIKAALQVGSDPKGGYLAPIQTDAGLLQYLDDEVFMRNLCTILPPLTKATSLGKVSLETDPNDADWTAEIPAADIAEDTAMAFGKRELTPHLLTKLIKISMKLLRVAVISPDTIALQRLGYKFAITEENAFLTGNGNQQPLGVFTASNDGIPTGRDVTCASDTAFTADEIIDLAYSLKGQYLARSTILLHRDTLKRIRKFKDGDGQYLWRTGIAGDKEPTILDRPYVTSENAPNTFTSGNYVMIIGDFKAGYWIVDALGLEVQRLDETFALRNQIGLLGRREMDGMPVLAEAFSRLVLA